MKAGAEQVPSQVGLESRPAPWGDNKVQQSGKSPSEAVYFTVTLLLQEPAGWEAEWELSRMNTPSPRSCQQLQRCLDALLLPMLTAEDKNPTCSPPALPYTRGTPAWHRLRRGYPSSQSSRGGCLGLGSAPNLPSSCWVLGRKCPIPGLPHG